MSIKINVHTFVPTLLKQIFTRKTKLDKIKLNSLKT